MALRETLELDLGRAQQEIDDLERALDRLSTSIAVDLDVNTRGLDSADRESEELRRELGRVEDAADRVADEGDRIGREYKEGTGKAEKGLKGMGGAMKAFIALAATGLVVDRIVDFGKAAVTAASDLVESTGKAEVVFGSFADEIFAFTETAPAALRLSTQEALEMTGTFGNLFLALGLSQQAAADLAPEIVQLGADLGSFNNIPVGETLEKLRAGLVGEAEPLRALGVNLDAATTKAKAFELGLADTNGVVDAAGLVQARWALILEQTGTAQGDAARTADTFAGATATLAAEWENFQAKIGEVILPALVELLPQLSDALVDLAPALIGAAEGFVALFDATEGGVSLGEIFTGVTSGLGQTIDLFKTAGIGAVGFAQLVTLQFGDAAGSFKKFGEEIGDFRENLAARISLQALVGDIAEGRDALDSLADAFLGLSKAGPDALSENFDKFARVSGVAASEVEKLQRYMLANPEIFELSTKEIEFLIRANRDLNIELLEGTAGFFHQGDAARLHGKALVEARKATDQAADATDDYTGNLMDQAAALKAADQAQKDYVTTLRGLADPVFRAIDAFADYQQLLEEVNEDSEITKEEQLELARAVLDVNDAFAGLDSTNIEAAIDAVAAALAIGTEEAALLLEQLGLLDGRRFSAEFELRLLGTSQQFIPEGANPGGTVNPPTSYRPSVSPVVNIYSPTTPDLDTSVSRAAQIIGAVSGMVA